MEFPPVSRWLDEDQARVGHPTCLPLVTDRTNAAVSFGNSLSFVSHYMSHSRMKLPRIGAGSQGTD